MIYTLNSWSYFCDDLTNLSNYSSHVSGAKVAYGLGWAGTGVSAVLNARSMIYKSRHIHLYNEKQKKKQIYGTTDDTDDDEYDEDEELDDESKNWAETIVEILKNPICDKTISEQADKLQKQIKRLGRELKRVEKNETIQLLLQR